MGERLQTQRRIETPVADFARMVEAGILREDDRIELIEGELIEMAPIGSNTMELSPGWVNC